MDSDCSNSKGQVALIPNDYLPVLRGQWIFPGEVEINPKRLPPTVDLKHGITRYDILVKISQSKLKKQKGTQWFPLADIAKANPSILLQKILQAVTPPTNQKQKLVSK